MKDGLFLWVEDAPAVLDYRMAQLPSLADGVLWAVAKSRAAQGARMRELANKIAGRGPDGEPQSWSNEDAEELARFVLRLAGDMP